MILRSLFLLNLFSAITFAAEAPKKPNLNAVEASVLFINPIDYTCVVKSGLYSTTLLLAPSSKLKSQGKPIAFSDIKVGQKVRLSTTMNTNQIMIDSLEVVSPPVVRTAPVPKPKLYTVKGQVHSYDPFTQMLTISAGGNTFFLPMSNKTLFKEPKDGEDSKGVSALVPGKSLEVVLQDFGPGRKEIASIKMDE